MALPRRPSLAAFTSAPLLVAVLLLATSPADAFQATPFVQTTNSQRVSKRCWPTTDPRVSFNEHRPHTILSMDTSNRSSSSSRTIDSINSYDTVAVPILSDSTKTACHQKAILLTGASRGLGKSLAHALSTCQPSLLILSGRDEAALREVQQECLQISKKPADDENDCATTIATFTKVEIVVCDLGDKSSVEELASQSLHLAEQCTSSGNNIDILINNGGISSRSSFLETKLDVDEKLMQVNFFSGAALAKRLVPGMVDKKDGMVIWISSVQGKLGTPYRTSYAASKFAVQGYCEALRSELTSSNVSVHVVSPGYIRTNLSVSAVMGDGRAYSKMDETTANGADPDEVAANILNSATAGTTDFVVAATLSAKAALWLKVLAPSFLESMLVKRFEKQKQKN